MTKEFIGIQILNPIRTIPVVHTPPEPPPPPPPSPIATGRWVDVSRDGSTIAVGHSTAGFDGGAIHMCRGVEFETVTTLTAPGGFGSVNEYGNGVATNEDGSIVVCGALHNGGVFIDGYAAVRYGTNWANEIELEPAGSSIFLAYGGNRPVAISDDGSIIVLKDDNSLWVCSGVDWGDVIELTPSVGGGIWTVAISGDGTVIAASNGADKAYIFSGENYATETIVTPSGDASEFGWSIALNSDGSILVAGDPSVGAVSIFSGTDWATEQTIVDMGPEFGSPSNYFGWAVDISADSSVIAFSAYGKPPTPIVYRRSGAGYSVETSEEVYSLDLALSEDGSVMAAAGASAWFFTY